MSWSLDPKRPNPEKYPEAWYQFWEDEVKWSFSRPWEVLTTDLTDADFMKEPDHQFVRQLRLQIANRRLDISEVFDTVNKQGKSIEKEWANKSIKQREQILVQALVRLTSLPQVEDMWQWCPEVNKKNLCGGMGDGFMKLTKHFLVDDLSKRPSLEFPILKSTQVWRLFDIKDNPLEYAVKHPATKEIHDMFIVCRHYFLMSVILGVLSAVVGFNVNTVFVKGAKVTNATTETINGDYDRSKLPEYVWAAMAEARKKLRKLQKTVELHDQCAHCLKFAKATSGNRMACCAGCKKVGRTVTYCSRDCQKEDYRNGDPPHKLVCSKSLRDVALPHVKTDSGLDPFPLYTDNPSAALLYQAHCLLRDDDKYSYYLTNEECSDAVGQNLEPTLGENFREVREKAMFERDLSSIARMYRVISTKLKDGDAQAKLRAQLEREYEVDLDECVATLEVQEAGDMPPVEDLSLRDKH
ncbi:hypothetical protein HGRIS_002712 [Hohenbuehelia grisea]|uniref:MYND-type domain-containing protein n=1 Tax=Hohenbuehelia grisea TaxID=104357 RepID=A0ABR3JN78_9AGAR